MGAITFSIDPTLVRFLADEIAFEVFVETGTYKGDTVERVQPYFAEIISIEAAEPHFEAATARFEGDASVTLVHGDSATVLADLQARLKKQTALFWLDAHWCAGEQTAGTTSQCPLLPELNAIGTLKRHSVVLIDDARFFLAPPGHPHDYAQWPRFHEVWEGLRRLSTHHELMVINDVLVYYPASLHEALRAFAHEHGVDWLALADRGRDYDVLLQEIEAKEAGLATIHQAAEERLQRLRQFEQDLAGKEQVIEAKDRALAAKDAVIASKEDVIQAHQREQLAQDAALAEKDETLAAQESALAAKEAVIEAQQGRIGATEKALAERDAALAERDRQIAAHLNAIKTAEKALAEHDQALRETARLVQAKDAELVAKETVNADQAARIQAADAERAALAAQLAEQQESLAAATKTLADRDRQIAAHFDAIKAAEKALAASQAEVLAQHAALAARDAIIQAKDEELAARERERTAQDALHEAQARVLAGLEAQLEEAETAQAAQDAALAEKRALLQARADALAEQEALVAHKDGELSEKETFIQTQEQALRDKEAVIQQLDGFRRSSWRYWFGHVAGPFLMRLVRRPVQAVRAGFRPRLGTLEQHPPTPLRLPRRYQATRCTADPPPRISVVTPSYNHAAYLERTIESVLGQQYPALEYIVQDGGSTDGTAAILDRYRDRCSHVQSGEDRGQAHAINLGFEHATGEVMAWLNSDDLLLPGALAYVANFFAQNPEVDVVYGHRILIDEQDREIGRWILPGHDDAILNWADYVPQETLFWRRRIWNEAGGSLDETFRFALDWDLLLRFQDAGARFVRLPRFLGAFRIYAAQKTLDWADVGQEEMTLLRERANGRAVTWPEINANIRAYLRRSTYLHLLHQAGLLRA